ncbi:unnamed protein product [Scytosiphon promiscuus]
MSRSPTSSDEDPSSEENSSDQGSSDESGSASGSGRDSSDGSGSDSGSGSEESSNGSGSGSGSGSGEDNESDSSSSGSTSDGDSEEEGEVEVPEEEGKDKRMAGKREDFEKMKQLSAHMDNVVKRLQIFFPIDDTGSERAGDVAVPGPVAPDLPPLALPPPTIARESSTSTRVITMDRAVSARRLMTDRAVSVASGMHFDDVLSGSTASNSSFEENRLSKRRGGGGGAGTGGRSRRKSKASIGTGVDRGESDGERSDRHRGGRKRDKSKKENPRGNRRSTIDSWSGKDGRASGVGKTFTAKAEQDRGRRKSRVLQGRVDASFGAGGSREKLLWDELRESLKEAVDGSGGAMPSQNRERDRDGAYEKAREERAREEQRRRLIDEAIAVLLEGSSSGASSSDDERAEPDSV